MENSTQFPNLPLVLIDIVVLMLMCVLDDLDVVDVDVVLDDLDVVR